MTDKRHLKVFLASPGDVQPERECVRRAVAEVEKVLEATGHHLALDLKQWETDAYPGLHAKGAQGLIDEALKIDECDILIGIFWKRFGAPVYDAGSGTEHEIRVAYQRWQKTEHPEIMLYFSKQPHFPQSADELDQWKRVLLFEEEFKKLNLAWGYRDLADFEQSLRLHLIHVCLKRPLSAPSVEVPGSLQLHAAQTELRCEGLTEPIAELVLSFSPALLVSRRWIIQLFLNVFITNRFVTSDLTDIELSVDDSNVVPLRGRLVTSNGVAFEDVLIVPASDGSAQLRVRNILVAANALGEGPSVETAAIATPRDSTVSTDAHTIVATVKRGFRSAVVSSLGSGDSVPLSISRSKGINPGLTSFYPAHSKPNFYIRFREEAAHAFRSRHYEVGGEKGTRLRAVFVNVPAGVRIFVTVANVDPGEAPFAPQMAKLSGDSALHTISGDYDAGSRLPASHGYDSTIRELSISARLSTAVWEWVDDTVRGLAQRAEVYFGVVLSSEPGKAELGKALVGCSFYPISFESAASSTAPIPRFRDTSEGMIAFEIVP